MSMNNERSELIRSEATQVLLKNNSFKLTVGDVDQDVEHFINLLEAYEESIPEDRYLYFDFTDGALDIGVESERALASDAEGEPEETEGEPDDLEEQGNPNVEWFFGDYPNFVVFDCSGYAQDLDLDTFCDMLSYLSSFDGLSGIQCNYIHNFKTVYLQIDLLEKVITLVSCFMESERGERGGANRVSDTTPQVKRQQKKIRLSATTPEFFRQVVGN
jgi:hypothetical protein